MGVHEGIQETTLTALKVEGKTVWYHLNHCCRAEEPGRTQEQVKGDLQRAVERQDREETSAEHEREEGAAIESRSEEVDES